MVWRISNVMVLASSILFLALGKAMPARAQTGELGPPAAMDNSRSDDAAQKESLGTSQGQAAIHRPVSAGADGGKEPAEEIPGEVPSRPFSDRQNEGDRLIPPGDSFSPWEGLRRLRRYPPPTFFDPSMEMPARRPEIIGPVLEPYYLGGTSGTLLLLNFLDPPRDLF